MHYIFCKAIYVAIYVFFKAIYAYESNELTVLKCEPTPVWISLLKWKVTENVAYIENFDMTPFIAENSSHLSRIEY